MRGLHQSKQAGFFLFFDFLIELLITLLRTLRYFCSFVDIGLGISIDCSASTRAILAFSFFVKLGSFLFLTNLFLIGGNGFALVEGFFIDFSTSLGVSDDFGIAVDCSALVSASCAFSFLLNSNLRLSFVSFWAYLNHRHYLV